MKFPCSGPSAAAAAILALATGARSAPAAPDFDVAYRAWDVVTDVARHHRDPNLGGECGKTFRPFVIPGLKRQTRQEQDLAATACVAAARSVCADGGPQRTPDIIRKCQEFR